MSLTQQETTELRRVLAAFKANLPRHELGDWHIEIQPHRVTVEDERELVMPAIRVGFGYVEANARCLRCRMLFGTRKNNIPVSSFWVREEGDHADAVAKAKESVEKDADRSGPCWGDVPESPRDEAGYATMDAVAATQEP